jgi:ubiquinone/menaquinone biosynthesis C-methylase UbiE
MLEQCLKSEVDVREIAPRLYSALDIEIEGARYDSVAPWYDRAVSADLYLRIAWGGRRAAQLDFVQRAFDSRDGGWVLDLAAGSSVDAAPVYASTRRPVLVVDRSLEMLRKGRERLQKLTGALPEHVFFLQADALSLPLVDRCVSTLLCHGSFHVLPSLGIVMSEWRRVLDDSGAIFVSSLVLGRWLGDRYLAMLHRLGEVNPPLTADGFRQTLADGIAVDFDLHTEGNFAYASARVG